MFNVLGDECSLTCRATWGHTNRKQHCIWTFQLHHLRWGSCSLAFSYVHVCRVSVRLPHQSKLLSVTSHFCHFSVDSLSISVKVNSLPSSLPDTNDTDVPPPKLFLEEELFPPPPESGEPHWNDTPLLPPKANLETPHLSNVHQHSGEQWVIKLT